MGVAFRYMDKVLVNQLQAGMVFRLEERRGFFSYAQKTYCFRKESGHAQMTQESKLWENFSEVKWALLFVPWPQGTCKTFRPSQSAGKGNLCRKLVREELLI